MTCGRCGGGSAAASSWQTGTGQNGPAATAGPGAAGSVTASAWQTGNGRTAATTTSFEVTLPGKPPQTVSTESEALGLISRSGGGGYRRVTG